MPSSTFYLIGLSKTSAYALYPLIGLYWLLAIYIVVGGWPRGGERQQIGTLWFVALPTTAFFALLLAGGIFWSLVCWSFWGDVGWDAGKLVAGSIAVVIAAILLNRLATGRVFHSYVRFNVWVILLCYLFFSGMYFINFVEGIDGWSASGAAENQFAYLMKPSKFYPANLPRKVVDETTPLLAGHGGKAFALYIGDARAAEIRVMPYYHWWWAVSYSRTFAYGNGELSIPEQMQLMRESLNDQSRDQ